MTKQKIEMKRHLEKEKKCEIKNNIHDLSETELYNLSLQKYEIYKKNENKDGNLGENKDGNLDENKDGNLGENKDDNLGENKDDNLSENKDDNLDENKDGNLGENNNINNNKDFNQKNEQILNKFTRKEIHEIYPSCENFNINNKDNYCEKCDKYFYHKSNLNKHLKKDICNKKEKKNNIQQHIGIQNNIINNNQKIINININYMKGFDEEWDVSKIDDKKKGEILLSNSKFSKTLENILKNDVNLNVILNDDNTGLVYKNEKNKYEPMTNKNIIELSMEKVYKHLKDFYQEITKNNINDLSEVSLKNELVELEKKYSRFFRLEEAQNIVKKSFTEIYNIHKQDAEQKFYELLEDDNLRKDGY